MAHKGRLWPVLFRRDWGLNIFTNRDNFANRYIWQPDTGTRGFGTLIGQFKWDLGPAKQTAFSIMTWDTTPIRTFGFTFRCTITVEIRPGGQTYQKLINVFELNVGMIYSGQIVGDPDTSPSFNITHPGAHTVFWDPAWYDNDPFYYANGFQQKFWIDGPPH